MLLRMGRGVEGFPPREIDPPFSTSDNNIWHEGSIPFQHRRFHLKSAAFSRFIPSLLHHSITYWSTTQNSNKGHERVCVVLLSNKINNKSCSRVKGAVLEGKRGTCPKSLLENNLLCHTEGEITGRGPFHTHEVPALEDSNQGKTNKHNSTVYWREYWHAAKNSPWLCFCRSCCRVNLVPLGSEARSVCSVKSFTSVYRPSAGPLLLESLDRCISKEGLGGGWWSGTFPRDIRTHAIVLHTLQQVIQVINNKTFSLFTSQPLLVLEFWGGWSDDEVTGSGFLLQTGRRHISCERREEREERRSYRHPKTSPHITQCYMEHKEISNLKSTDMTWHTSQQQFDAKPEWKLV